MCIIQIKIYFSKLGSFKLTRILNFSHPNDYIYFKFGDNYFGNMTLVIHINNNLGRLFEIITF